MKCTLYKHRFRRVHFTSIISRFLKKFLFHTIYLHLVHTCIQVGEVYILYRMLWLYSPMSTSTYTTLYVLNTKWWIYNGRVCIGHMHIVHAEIHDSVTNLCIRRRHTRITTQVQTKVVVYIVTSGRHIQNIYTNTILRNTCRDVAVYQAPLLCHCTIEVVNSHHPSGLYGM